MRSIYAAALLLLAASAISTLANMQPPKLSLQSASAVEAASNVSLIYILSGNVTNAGRDPIYINETDIMVFDYPLETEDQIVHKVVAAVNDREYNYSVVEISGTKHVVIQSPHSNSTLEANQSISVSVKYYVSVNMTRRLYTIVDFHLVDDPYKLLNKAGSWKELEGVADESNTKLTSLWNYTHPLVRLLVKYLNETIVSDKPFAYLLAMLDWIDSNIVYSTRVPPRFPWEVIVEGAGDCDDQSNLLISLLRAMRIPCYLEVGVVYVGENYYHRNVEADGYYTYEFVGGGGHGWVVVYIPPWGWIRVDPIVRRDPGTGERAPLYRVGIKYALYYVLPTIVISRVHEKDYVEESVKFVEEIRARKLKVHVVLEVYELSGP